MFGRFNTHSSPSSSSNGTLTPSPVFTSTSLSSHSSPGSQYRSARELSPLDLGTPAHLYPSSPSSISSGGSSNKDNSKYAYPQYAQKSSHSRKKSGDASPHSRPGHSVSGGKNPSGSSYYSAQGPELSAKSVYLVSPKPKHAAPRATFPLRG